LPQTYFKPTTHQYQDLVENQSGLQAVPSPRKVQSNQQQTEKIANNRQLVGFKQSPGCGSIVKTVRIQFAIRHHGIQNAEHAFQPIFVGENDHFRLKKLHPFCCQKGAF